MLKYVWNMSKSIFNDGLHKVMRNNSLNIIKKEKNAVHLTCPLAAIPILSPSRLQIACHEKMPSFVWVVYHFFWVRITFRDCLPHDRILFHNILQLALYSWHPLKHGSLITRLLCGPICFALPQGPWHFDTTFRNQIGDNCVQLHQFSRLVNCLLTLNKRGEGTPRDWHLAKY